MTEGDLQKIQRDIQRRTRTPLTKADIGVRVGRVLFHYKMGKHFLLEIEDGALSWQRRQDQIEGEAALDGLYVIRTSEPADQLSAEDAVRTYKSLAHVERAFRSLTACAPRTPIFTGTSPISAASRWCWQTSSTPWTSTAEPH